MLGRPCAGISDKIKCIGIAAVPFLLAAGALFLANPSLEADPGLSSMEFLQLPVGAVGTGMAEAYGGESSLEATEVNPSVLANYKGTGLQATHEMWLSDITNDTVLGAFELGNEGGVGIYLGYTNLGYQQSAQPSVIPGAYYTLGDYFNNYAYLMQVSYGRKLGDFLSLGAGVKIAQEVLYSVSSMAVAFDVGASWVEKDLWTFALSVKNIGAAPTPYLYDTSPLPLLIRLGMSKTFKFSTGWTQNNSFKLAIDGKFFSSDDKVFCFGGEYQTEWVKDNSVALRIGYSRKTIDQSISNFNFGAGWTGVYKDFALSLDYALTPFMDFGNTHLLTLGVHY